MRDVILIFGKTGTGKSTLAKKLAKDLPRKIIIDSQLEYHEGIIFETYYSFREFLLKNYNETNSFSYILRFESDEEHEEVFRLLYNMNDIMILLEEAEIYISPNAKKSNFLRLVRYGRHHNISLLGIARRTAELSTNFQAQVNTIYSFRQTIPIDVEKMERLGLFGTDILPPYKYIRKDY